MQTEGGKSGAGLPDSTVSPTTPEIRIALLTGGADRPYVFGLASSLISKGVSLDLIGSDELDFPHFHNRSGVNFLNLRGSQRPDATFATKVSRILRYYAKLIRYVSTAKPTILHILWNNKFELFDRTLLMLYYRMLGKRVALTVHNVNAGRRDSKDTSLNRRTLRIQYMLSDHIFVHTEKMRLELIEEFGASADRITVIPFGLNNAVPITDITPAQARQRLGIGNDKKTVLFFGNITPYKGLEYLIAAFRQVLCGGEEYQLIIAGRPDRCEKYWRTIQQRIDEETLRRQVLLRAEFIPDEETELYFKAADVLVLPYRHVYQSGVLFLGYSFGVPVIAADVGSLKDTIAEGKTGFVFKPEDANDLTKTIERYFASDLFTNLDNRRQEIRAYAAERHSWDVVGQITMSIYGGLLHMPSPEQGLDRDTSRASLDAKASS